MWVCRGWREWGGRVPRRKLTLTVVVEGMGWGEREKMG